MQKIIKVFSAIWVLGLLVAGFYWGYERISQAIESGNALAWQYVADMLRGFGLFMIGVGIAPFGLYLAFNRTATLQEQQESDNKRRISEEFSSAVKLLGDGKASARQGGIYALRYLAKEEAERQETVIRIVGSFIREETRSRGVPSADDVSEAEGAAPGGGGDKVQVDVEAALSVIKDPNIGRGWYTAGKRQYMFDLSESNLRNGDLTHADLVRVNMSNIAAKNFGFEGTDFSNANIVWSTFDSCDFTDATLDGAELRDAEFKNRCNFQNATLLGAELDGADLTGAINLTQQQINDAKGNQATKLPIGLEHPRDWR